MKLAPSGRSDSHSVRALRAVKSHPFGAGLHSNGRGAAPVHACLFAGGAAQAQYKMFLRTSRGVKCGACCEVCGSETTSFARLHRMPVEDLCRRFASPLFVGVVRRRCGDGRAFFLTAHWIENFVSHAFAYIPCAIVSLHEEADPHTTRKFFIVCGSAVMFATREQRGAAVRRDAKRAREYRYSSRTRPALIAGQFVRAALYLCGLLRIRSPAPRRDVVRPLEKETVRFLKNRTGGLMRPAVCTVPAASSFVTFHSSLEKKESNDHGLACHKRNNSYVSATYELALQARGIVGKIFSSQQGKDNFDFPTQKAPHDWSAFFV